MNNYNANSIETLEFADAIRKRVAMYLGDAGMNGVYQAIREIITNSIDEYTVGYGNEINVSVIGNRVSISDNARGVPFGVREDGTEAMVAIYTSAHSGGKFDSKVYQNVAGLNGIGAKATALSSKEFIATSVRDGQEATLIVRDGEVVSFKTIKSNSKNTGTVVTFEPSPEVFHLEDIVVDFEVVKDMCKTWAYLSPGLTFNLTNGKAKVKYAFKNGIVDLLKDNLKKPLHKTIFHKKVEDEDGNKVEIAFQWSKERFEKPFVFTNGLENTNGGTSLTGAKTSLTRTVNNLSGVKLSGDSIRTGLVYVISASVLSPSFSDQTKTKINNPELRSLTDRAFSEALREFAAAHEAEWETITSVLVREEMAEKAAESARAKMLNTENEIKSSDKKRNGLTLSSKIADATNKTGYKELYLTEGDSASAYLKSERDSGTQGVMPLKGKILNTFDLDLTEAYENEEVKTLINLMGCGAGSIFNIGKMRYNKIIITADADADGKHIEILVMGLFLKHMPELIKQGYVYRAVAPLYGTNTPKGYKMFFYENELEEYERTHGKITNLDRYKGLGAMSEEQVGHYLMNDKTRKIEKVTMEDAEAMEELFETFLGKSEVGKSTRRELVRTGGLSE